MTREELEELFDRRIGERRERCEFHESRDLEIRKIGSAISKHSGQWKVLMWGIGIVGAVIIAGLITFTTHMQESMSDMNKTMLRMDKTISEYIASHKQETISGFQRIRKNEKHIHENQQRIIELERLVLP